MKTLQVKYERDNKIHEFEMYIKFRGSKIDIIDLSDDAPDYLRELCEVKLIYHFKFQTKFYKNGDVIEFKYHEDRGYAFDEANKVFKVEVTTIIEVEARDDTIDKYMSNLSHTDYFNPYRSDKSGTFVNAKITNTKDIS